MTHDVYICHSPDDDGIADAICTELEQDGIGCWIAPRDLVPGTAFVQSIAEAISTARLTVLVLSESANSSFQVAREIEHSAGLNVPVLPIRVDDVVASPALEQFISDRQWFDALTAPLEQHLARLVGTVRLILEGESPRDTPSAGYSGVHDATAADVTHPGDARTVEASPAALVEPAAPKIATGRSRTFRLFVSSTFNDFELERDTLRERVWPRLEQYCEQRGARFQAVDLRWGVGSEAAADQQTMNICLGEIERCHRVTPRPNFLILVGDHYGWRPLPPQIPAKEFDTLAGHLSKEDRALADEWYELDDNARPALRRLRPRRDEFKQDDIWAKVETRLHPALQKAAEEAGFEEERSRVYRTSATEQEIVAGAFEAGEPDQVVCVLRHFDLEAGLAGAAEREKIGQFVDADPAPIDALRVELRARLADRIVGPSDYSKPGTAFTLPWGDSAAERDYLNGFAERVAGQLEASIDAELREPRHRAGQLATPRRPLRSDDLLDVEGWAHHDFAEDRTGFFVGRQNELSRIDRYLEDNHPEPMAVIGGGGTGKSAIIGEAVRRTLERHNDAIVVYRFIGATPGSSDGRTLLESICQELARRSGTSERDVPSDFGDLAVDFRTRLEPPAGRRVIVFIDSLDQLGDSDGARGLAWIPGQLPAGARLVISTRPGETLDPLSTRAEQVLVPPLPVLDGGAALDLWLDAAGRTLHDPQPGEVLKAFERSQGNPLYLRLAFEEARRWPFPEPSDRPHKALAVSTDGETGVVEPIIRDNLLARLETEHGQILIAHALGYLGTSRYGLAESELIDLLSADPEVYRWFLLGSYHLPSDLVVLAADLELGDEPAASADADTAEARARTWLTEVIGTARDGTDAEKLDAFLDAVLGGPGGPKLPVVLWSRLFFDLEPYLAERQVEDVVVLDFYHRELRDVTAAQYGSGEQGRLLHERIARYFHTRADPGGQGSWQGEKGRVDRRGLAELPYHLTCAQRWDDIYKTLTDFTFLENKAAHVGGTRRHEGDGNTTRCTGVFRLQDDYQLALAKATSETIERRSTLEEFVRALRRESHALQSRPGLLWQQLHNRLQWAGAPVMDLLIAERERRSKPGGRPWIHRYSRLRESDALICTLAGHLGPVNACAVSPDGTWLVSAGDDSLLKIWDVATGVERVTCFGHEHKVQGCTVTPDGTRVVSFSYDNSLRIWDAATGAQRAVCLGHQSQIRDLKVSPDGSWMVSASDDTTLKIWDALQGFELKTLEGHDGAVTGCAISPDGRRIVSAGYDGTVRTWDVATGRQLVTIASPNATIRSCAISPDGTWILSASHDDSLKIWDAATGEVRHTLTPNGLGMATFAISPDGSYIVSAPPWPILRIWDVATGTERATLRGHTNLVQGCAISPDGSWIVSYSVDNTLRMWDAATGAPRAVLTGHSQEVEACAVSPDGGFVVSASKDGTLKIWDSDASRGNAIPEGHTSWVNTCAISPDGGTVVSAGQDGTVRLWDVATGARRAVLEGHGSWVNECAVGPDSARAVSASRDGTLKIWDLATGTERCTLEGHESEVLGCAMSQYGGWLASYSADNTVKIWEVESGREIRSFEAKGVTDCAISPDARFVAWTNGDLNVWRFADRGESVASTASSSLRAGASACAVAPDGDRIATVSAEGAPGVWQASTALAYWYRPRKAETNDSSLRVMTRREAVMSRPAITHGCAVSPACDWVVSYGGNLTPTTWETSNGDLRADLFGHDDRVNACAVSPDGAWVATAGADGIVKIWDADTGSELATLPVSGEALALAFHPVEPIVVCGDEGGNVNLLRLMGLQLGPLATTAISMPYLMHGYCAGAVCPACRGNLVLRQEKLGTVVRCGNEACGTQLRINQFVLDPNTELPPAARAPVSSLAPPAMPATSPATTLPVSQSRSSGRRWFRRR